ncbi:MAG: ATP-binding protein [Sulfuricurvum sp.]
MTTLLDEYYRYDLHNHGFIERKTSIGDNSVFITGIAQSGKTSLIKHYLLSHKKSTYLYLDCNDIRIDINELNQHLPLFSKENKLSIVALDNYRPDILLPDVDQVILSCESYHDTSFEHIQLNLLDFEEFLAFEHKFDSTALNHFFQLGGFPAMHSIVSEERMIYLQRILRIALEPVEFDIVGIASKMITQKVSAHNLYERLKHERKISKDKLYHHVQMLLDKRYLHQLEKYHHPNAVKKLYLCDIAIKHALNLQKHFGRIFENLIFLEMFKHSIECYYEEGIDFFLPERRQIILAMPFANEHALFKKVEMLEGFIIMHGIEEIIAVTMNLESSLSHPIARIEMIPFAQWALGEE